ncbi:hypothetical protein M4951_03740 [Blastopirellula sp. J2-11]|uniref:hypothetical protein n=1 Tax=Blastopirellula sp. J2-11 TaxID=2943192 RepID=UPI0021C83573|nr:hypothetical protein [Blastopirellula sp. J2-11]UUO07427.1 hypothetical protein M4951_03740 [Blastopirellula sp. J2-11]
MSSSNNFPSLFTHVDVTAGSPSGNDDSAAGNITMLLQRMVTLQERQAELLEEMLQQQISQQKQRQAELAAWRKANPQLADKCRKAAEALSKVHTEFLGSIADEIDDSGEDMADSEFMLNEFVDRFGPRIAHLNGVLQMLAQLGSPHPPAK